MLTCDPGHRRRAPRRRRLSRSDRDRARRAASACRCATKPASDDACPSGLRTPRAVRARRAARADPGAGRRLRHRTHVSAAQHPRAARPQRGASTSTSSGRRPRRSGCCGPCSRPRRSSAADVGADARSPREAFDDAHRVLPGRARPTGGPATFLLDEFLELRTFESFPGLRHVLHDLLGGPGGESTNRFVLTTATSRARCACCATGARASRSSTSPPLSADELREVAGPTGWRRRRRRLLRAVHALTDGHAGYVAARLPTRMRDIGPAATRSARWRRCCRPTATSPRELHLLLRAAPASRARLRRAQGDPRHPRRGGTADAHRDRAFACSARRARRRTTCRGSRTSIWSACGRSATHSPIRCCACGCACTAGPSRRARISSQGSAALRARAPAAGRRAGARRRAPRRRPQVGHHRDRLAVPKESTDYTDSTDFLSAGSLVLSVAPATSALACLSVPLWHPRPLNSSEQLGVRAQRVFDKRRAPVVNAAPFVTRQI